MGGAARRGRNERSARFPPLRRDAFVLDLRRLALGRGVELFLGVLLLRILIALAAHLLQLRDQALGPLAEHRLVVPSTGRAVVGMLAFAAAGLAPAGAVARRGTRYAGLGARFCRLALAVGDLAHANAGARDGTQAAVERDFALRGR